jgi:SAM-dependent methyltransferase
MLETTSKQPIAIDDRIAERAIAMNEEFKSGALPRGVAESNDEQGHHPVFATNADLNDFLIRRQLLAMQSKRIQELLAEAEAELKNRQVRLVDIRHGALASLRDHFAQLEEHARIEKLRRAASLTPSQKLKNLPKAAERSIRRRGKQLFASRKTVLAEATDRPDPAGAQHPGWHLPKVRSLYGWTRWFAENDPLLHEQSRLRKDRIQVALVVSGGTGDLLESTHLVGPISDHFCCDVTVIAAQSNAGEIVAHNPYVFDTLVPVTEHVFDFVERLRNIAVFDLIITWKYNVQYIIPIGSRIPSGALQSIETSSGLRERLDRYCSLIGWPYFNFAFSRDVGRLGMSAMDASVATSSLPRRNLNEIPFFPSKQSLRVVGRLLERPYVTVHHGFDMKFLPARTRKTDYSSTKNLSMTQWAEIVSLLRREGIEVIQLGVVEEERIEGVTHCLNGQTTLDETALLIKHGLCHIDTEGGLVHLAHAVHARCVVVFGPTPSEFFGYPQNINLEPSGCKACWFTAKTWLIECPRHTRGPDCMSEHSPAKVAEAAKRIIAEGDALSARLIAAETRPAPAEFGATVATALTLLGGEAANRPLLIFDNPPPDIGSELFDGLPDGSEAIICAEKPLCLALNDRVVGRFEFGSAINLPRASSSVDAVVWVSRELESDIAPFALREIFRILRPGGELVFAAAGESAGLDLRRSLSAARIGFDENETPPAPARFCSLRRSGPPAEAVPGRSGGSGMLPGQSHAIDPRLALIEQENMRQIDLVRDRVAERQTVIDEEHAVTDGAVQRGFGADGWIWISNNFADGYPGKFFLSGWRSPLEWAIFNRDERCLLMLPYPEELSPGPQRVELQLHLAVPSASASNPTAIGIRVDDRPIENFRLSAEDAIVTLQISTEFSKFRGVSLVEFHLDDSIVGGGADAPIGNLGMGVRRFRYRTLSS